MSHAPRVLASLTVALAGIAAVGLAAPASSDPDVHGESASAVIAQLQQQGYDVEVNGNPAGDPSLLTTCTVTSIHNPGVRGPDSTTIRVDVACPLIHG